MGKGKIRFDLILYFPYILNKKYYARKRIKD